MPTAIFENSFIMMPSCCIANNMIISGFKFWLPCILSQNKFRTCNTNRPTTINRMICFTQQRCLRQPAVTVSLGISNCLSLAFSLAISVSIVQYYFTVAGPKWSGGTTLILCVYQRQMCTSFVLKSARHGHRQYVFWWYLRVKTIMARPK